MGSQAMAALLAAVANDPELMEPFRDLMRERFEQRILSDGPAKRSTVLFLAALGLTFADLLSMPFMESEDRKVIYAYLSNLAANKEEGI
jgi:hypothetical protein